MQAPEETSAFGDGGELFEDELSQLAEAEDLVASLTGEQEAVVAAGEPATAAEVAGRSDAEEAVLAEGDSWGEESTALMTAPEIEDAEAVLSSPDEPEASEEGTTRAMESEPKASADVASEVEVPEELAEEMAEAEFFVTQGLFEDALNVLRELLEPFGEHPALVSRIAAVQAQLEAGDGDELEDFGEELGEALDGLEATESEAADGKSGGLNIPRKESDAFVQFKEGVARQVGEDDSETHFDLGIAYREMGMVQDAIGEFEAAMRPTNEVQCFLMIAACHRDLGRSAEAVNVYKKALYCDAVTDAEQVEIYYQMGLSYEELDDPREGAYYLEKVDRQVQGYRDVAERLPRLRAAFQTQSPSNQNQVDNAFDELLGVSSPERER